MGESSIIGTVGRLARRAGDALDLVHKLQMPKAAWDESEQMLVGNEVSFVLPGTDQTQRVFRPSRELYPHQWNWDSMLMALGAGTIDAQRGAAEVLALLGAQTPDGRVPHIAFTPGVDSYLPGPEWWGNIKGGDGRHVSALSNPPVGGHVINRLLDLGADPDDMRVAVTKVQKWHDWYLRERTQPGGDLAVIYHPWESGRDDAREWPVYEAIVPTVKRSYQRLDGDHVADTGERPPNGFYDRVLGLVENGTEHGWDPQWLRDNAPFRVIDVGLNGLLASDAHELSQAARRLGMPDLADRAQANEERVTRGLNRLVQPDGSIYSVDLNRDVENGGRPLKRTTVGIPLAATPPGIDPRAIAKAKELVESGELSSEVGVLSTARSDPEFDARQYWGGPVWGNTTWLIGEAFERHGMMGTAMLMHERLTRFASLTDKEFMDPDTLEGLGGADFGWNRSLARYNQWRADPAGTEQSVRGWDLIAETETD